MTVTLESSSLCRPLPDLNAALNLALAAVTAAATTFGVVNDGAVIGFDDRSTCTSCSYYIAASIIRDNILYTINIDTRKGC